LYLFKDSLLKRSHGDKAIEIIYCKNEYQVVDIFIKFFKLESYVKLGDYLVYTFKKILTRRVFFIVKLKVKNINLREKLLV
jgi:hypothetical protein